MFVNDTVSAGDPPREEQRPPRTAKERRTNPQTSSVCRYYTAGNCRRGSSCRYVHSPLVGVQQEYAYAEGLDAQARTQCKGWHQNIPHGFTVSPTYTAARHVGPQGCNATRDGLDNLSDFSSSDDSVADQSLNTAFKVMAIKEPVSPELFPVYHSGFSQSSGGLQYPNNAVARYGNVPYAGYYPRDLATGSNVRGPTHKKADEAKKKSIAYRTKPCKFFSANKTCPQGDKCTFIHDVEKRRPKTTNHEDRVTNSPHLPPKPRSLLEDFKARDFYPINWRVIGGGVMMGGYRPPCKAFAAGYCPDGMDCRLAHETELETSTDGVVEFKSQPSSRGGSPCAQPSLDLSAESNPRRVSMKHFGSSSAVQGTYEGMSGGTEVHPSGREDKEEPSSAEKQSNAEKALPSQHRRTRSMSLPNSPSILTVPRIFAEL